jgi:hypothetical protein
VDDASEPKHTEIVVRNQGRSCFFVVEMDFEQLDFDDEILKEGRGEGS